MIPTLVSKCVQVLIDCSDVKFNCPTCFLDKYAIEECDLLYQASVRLETNERAELGAVVHDGPHHTDGQCFLGGQDHVSTLSVDESGERRDSENISSSQQKAKES